MRSLIAVEDVRVGDHLRDGGVIVNARTWGLTWEHDVLYPATGEVVMEEAARGCLVEVSR